MGQTSAAVIFSFCHRQLLSGEGLLGTSAVDKRERGGEGISHRDGRIRHEAAWEAARLEVSAMKYSWAPRWPPGSGGKADAHAGVTLGAGTERHMHGPEDPPNKGPPMPAPCTHKDAAGPEEG